MSEIIRFDGVHKTFGQGPGSVHAVEDVTVVSYEDVTWPDGALGCPEPGMSYTQALVPGARLVLEADGVPLGADTVARDEAVDETYGPRMRES